jgi:hypothetical protein
MRSRLFTCLICALAGSLSVMTAGAQPSDLNSQLVDATQNGDAAAVERLLARGAGGKLYYASEDGDVFVLKAEPTYELLATNPMGEVMMATPAISPGMLVIRMHRHIVGVGEK